MAELSDQFVASWAEAMVPGKEHGLRCVCGHRVSTHTHEWKSRNDQSVGIRSELRKIYRGCFAAGVSCDCPQFQVCQEELEAFQGLLLKVLKLTKGA